MISNDQNVYCLGIESRRIQDILGNIRPFQQQIDLNESVNLMFKDFDLPAEDVRNCIYRKYSNCLIVKYTTSIRY